MDLRAINYEQSIRAGSSAITEDYYPYPLSSLSLKTIPTPYPLFLNYSSGSITLKLLLLETPPPSLFLKTTPYSLPLITELLLWVCDWSYSYHPSIFVWWQLPNPFPVPEDNSVLPCSWRLFLPTPPTPFSIWRWFLHTSSVSEDNSITNNPFTHAQRLYLG